MEYVGLIMLVTPHIIAIGLGKITPEWWRMVYIIYVIVAVVFALKGLSPAEAGSQGAGIG